MEAILVSGARRPLRAHPASIIRHYDSYSHADYKWLHAIAASRRERFLLFRRAAENFRSVWQASQQASLQRATSPPQGSNSHLCLVYRADL
jgi:transposase-like protein